MKINIIATISSIRGILEDNNRVDDNTKEKLNTLYNYFSGGDNYDNDNIYDEFIRILHGFGIDSYLENIEDVLSDKETIRQFDIALQKLIMKNSLKLLKETMTTAGMAVYSTPALDNVLNRKLKNNK